MNVSGEYLIRFDDICPTMSWKTWDEIELLLNRFHFKPILGVVPDNQDQNLMRDEARPDFWNRVRDWQKQGWAIMLHGHQHRYVNKNPGSLKLGKMSEFAGLTRLEQKDKLQKGLAVFREQGIVADGWMAPSHSFDEVTVSLLPEVGINTITDGLWPWPHTANGVTWIPQQLWKFRPRKRGVWTVCYHANEWNKALLDQFARDLEKYRNSITNFQDVLKRYNGRILTLGDRLSAWWQLNFQIRAKGAAHALLTRNNGLAF